MTAKKNFPKDGVARINERKKTRSYTQYYKSGVTEHNIKTTLYSYNDLEEHVVTPRVLHDA